MCDIGHGANRGMERATGGGGGGRRWRAAPRKRPPPAGVGETSGGGVMEEWGEAGRSSDGRKRWSRRRVYLDRERGTGRPGRTPGPNVVPIVGTVYAS